MSKKKLTAKQMQSLIHFLIFINALLIVCIIILAVLLAKSQKKETQTFSYIKADSEYVVCIDAGHGGSDVGAEGIDGSYEKDDNLRLALLVEKNLKKSGVTVVMTRTDDSSTELASRSQIANEAAADLFVSLHRNSTASSDEVCGVEVWIHSSGSERSYAIANTILDNLEEVGVSQNRGVRIGTQDSSDSNYAVIRETDMTSLILEMGFMTNKTDIKLFNKNLEAYANAISNSIVGWLNEYVQ
ncbi:MAG: N-acetylmuramoyl-L-alanine amidase [Coprococcus sp.]